MRICYLLLVHHKFDQLLRLVDRLDGPHSSFVVHVDRKVAEDQVADLRNKLRPLDRVAFTQRVSSTWGAYEQALAIMECVKSAVEEMEPCDRYVLLSGQDYPIKGQAQILEFFAQHSIEEFIEAYPLDVMDAGSPGWSPYYRFRRYHMWLGGRHIALPFVLKGAPPLPIYHGSTWWALTRGAVTHVAREFASNTKLHRYLRTGFLVDEVYVPTLLMASPFAPRVVGKNVTFAEWTATSGPHPKTLRLADLEQLLVSPKLVARKFDAAVDEAVMSALDGLHATV